MPDLLFSIVIPNWNGLRFLETCLDALAAQTYPHTEVIIADNASQDGSQAFVREKYPWVRLVELPDNRGFTGECNAAV
jgi:GT2 family glycosyltransferase